MPTLDAWGRLGRPFGGLGVPLRGSWGAFWGPLRTILGLKGAGKQLKYAFEKLLKTQSQNCVFWSPELHLETAGVALEASPAQLATKW